MAGWYAVLLALIALTLGLYEFVPRYEPSDRQVLGNLDGADLAGWWTMGSVRRDPRRSRSVVLEVAGATAGASVLRRTVDLRTPATVILRAKIAADILESGDGSGGGAWMIVGNLAGSGPTSLYWEKGAYQPYLATSSHGWRSLEATSTVPAGRGVLAIEAGIGGDAGSVLHIAGLALLEASERTGFRIGRRALTAAWGLTVIRSVVVVWRSLESGWARLALGGLLAVATLELMVPASPQVSPFLEGAPGAIGHGLLFFLLTLTCRLGRPRNALWLLFGTLALVAAASEVVQSFVPGRGPQLHDWLADLAGIAAGLALSELVLRLYWRRTGCDRVR